MMWLRSSRSCSQVTSIGRCAVRDLPRVDCITAIDDSRMISCYELFFFTAVKSGCRLVIAPACLER
jgi:hypothetical protein